MCTMGSRALSQHQRRPRLPCWPPSVGMDWRNRSVWRQSPATSLCTLRPVMKVREDQRASFYVQYMLDSYCYKCFRIRENVSLLPVEI